MLVDQRPIECPVAIQRPGATHTPSASSRESVAVVGRKVAGIAVGRNGDPLAAILQRAVTARVASAVPGPSAPVLQRMFLQGVPVQTLAALNAALQSFPNLDRTMPLPPAAPAGAVPGQYVLPLTLAAFAPGATAQGVDQAIAGSGLPLSDWMEVNHVVDAVNTRLAAAAAAALAPPPPRPPAAASFDLHGYKHFGGGGPANVAQGGDQWSLTLMTAQGVMVAATRGIEQHLRAHGNAVGVTTYYYTTTHNANVGKSEGKATRKYTIQIDYNVAANTVAYHGYPDKAAVAEGLGYSKNNKQWHV
jgi:hypothetical protein